MDIIRRSSSSIRESILESDTSSGITRDINNAVLNNVATGYWHWIVVIALLSGVQNGMLPSISSFSLLPYGNDAYIYSVGISNVVTPICAILPAVCVKLMVHRDFIWTTTVGWMLCAAYILAVALQSPQPFGVSHGGSTELFWTLMIVGVSIVCALLLTLCKTCIIIFIKKTFVSKAAFLDEQTLEKGLSRIMEIVGIAVQVGSFSGAVIFFVLVNATRLFQQ